MNARLSFAAAFAVLMASLSLTTVIKGNSWLAVAIGAVIVVAGAGVVTRLSVVPFVVTTTVLVLICVMPLLTAPNWFARAGGLAIVAVSAASLTGARLFRALTILATYVTSLLIYITVAYTRASSFAWIIPTNNSMNELGHLTREAFSWFKFAPPVPDMGFVNLVAGVGIGLTAILVDLLAVRLRRPAIAGLPLLVLFSVPVATNLKSFGAPQSITFALGIAGFLILLSADGRERLRMWGRLVTFRHVQLADETGAGPDTRELSASGRRVGLAAVCLAVLVPLALPSVHVHDLFSTNGRGRGGNTTVALRPLVEVQQDLTRDKAVTVLTYTTNAPDPSQQYLQAYVMNYNAHDNTWLPTFPASQFATVSDSTPLGAVVGQDSSTPTFTVKTVVTTSPNQGGQAILPMPYAPIKLDIGGGPWTEVTGSSMIFSQRPLANLKYTVTSRVADPTMAQINAAEAAGTSPPSPIVQYDNYAGPDANKLLSIANRHTAGAKTELDRVLDLQNWFLSSDFSYSLKTNLPNSQHWLVDFLTTDRKGFCQQFAWAFAALVRTLGYPVRIAAGFTGGTAKGNGVYQVTTADAHVWPEVYFSGEGWLRFEPTPGGPQGQGTASLPAYASGATSNGGPGQATNPNGQNTSNSNSSGGKNQAGAHNRFGDLPNGPAAGVTHTGSGSKIGYAIGIPLGIFVLLAWPSITRLVTRRRRWMRAANDADRANAAWAELTDDLEDYGYEFSPGETPRTLTKRIAREAGLSDQAATALKRIGSATERARYAPTALSGAGMAGDVQTVRRSLASARSRGQRLRAIWLPASTLTAAWQLTQRAGDLFNWLDVSWPALQRRLRRSVQRHPA